MKHRIRIFTLLLFSLSILSMLILSMPSSFADTSVITTTSIAVPSSCSITANNSSPHTATVFPGHEETEIGSTTMAVQCNDGSGSKIYAIGYSNDTPGTTNMIDSNTNITVPTGTGTSSSNWSMKLSIPTGNTAPTIRNDATYDFTDYEVVPSSYAQVAAFTSATDGINNSSFLVTYRAYMAGSQTPGAYTGKVKYVLIHPGTALAPSVYTISYADASNEGTGLPTSQTGDVSSTVEVTLSSTEPTRADHTFMGWCTVNNSADTSTCSGTTYDAGDTYTITNTGTATTITLYAVWKRNAKTIADSDTMQEVEACDDSVPANTTYSIMDGRDNQYYTVAKLADGKCWMTTNLNLAGGTQLSSSNTDMDASWTLPTGSGFGSDNKLPASSLNFSTEQNDARLYNSGKTTNCASGNELRECYSYYSWTAATLGSGNSISTDDTDAPYSICPKGWRLPNSRSTVAGNSDAYQLAVAYGMSNNVTYQNNNASFYNNAGPNSAVPKFLLSGCLLGTNSQFPSSTEGTGYYWTSTSWSTNYQAYSLEFTSTSIESSSARNRRYGFSVRCVFRGE